MRCLALVGLPLVLSTTTLPHAAPAEGFETSPKSWPSAAAIDAFIEKEFKVLGAPGLAVAIVQNGKVVYAKGFGFADVQNSVPVRPDAVFRLGSITKQFTATLVMQLVQQGKLSLDASLGSVLPSAPKAWAGVTIRQLLSHTAGIPNYTATPEFVSMMKADVTVDHINDSVASKPLDFAAGSSWNYSNSGYILLGQIIEKVTGKPYVTVLHERILDPLGMKSTYFVSETQIVKNRAYGYTMSNGKLVQSTYINMGWPFSAGSMESTVLDLAKWDAALYTDRLLPQSALAAMWTPITLTSGKTHDYGFGWSLCQRRSKTTELERSLPVEKCRTLTMDGPCGSSR